MIISGEIVYGIVGEEGVDRFANALRSGTKLAASYRQIPERRAQQ